MKRTWKPAASFALAWLLAEPLTFAANVSGKVDSVPRSLGGGLNWAGHINTEADINVGMNGPQGLSIPFHALTTQLAAIQAHPVEALTRLRISQALPDTALYTLLAHPEAIAQQGETLATMIGPENFHTLAATAQNLNRLAAQNNEVKELLSSGGNPAAALENFKKHFDGTAHQVPISDNAVSVPSSFSQGIPHNSGLKPAVPNQTAFDREMLSLGEKIARNITRDESLKLVSWSPLWEGDRPTWRLFREGGNLRIQYVPEDLHHANKDVAMAHLMQEVFRAVYSRPNLIEPDLQSNSLFQMLYDTMETGRVVKKGVQERPGLFESFDALNREQYGNPDEEAASRGIKDLPSYLQFLEGALYESRLGREDPRIKDPRMRDVLEKTRSVRNKIVSAPPEEAYRLSRELWPTLQKLYEESEHAEMSQRMFQKMGQEDMLEDKSQNAAVGSGRIKIDDLNNQKQWEHAQKGIEKLLKEMTPKQREEIHRQIHEQMHRQEQAFRKTMGKSPNGSQALSEALSHPQLSGPKGEQDFSGKPSSDPPTLGGQTGQDDPLTQLLKTWSQQKNGSGDSGPPGKPEGSQGNAQDGGDEINPSGTQGTSDLIGQAEDKIEKIKSGGLDAGERSWLEEYLEPVRGMIDTLAYKIRKHLKETALGRDLSGLYEGDVDEDALPYYKAKIGIMKEEFLPGRPKSRITILLDLSGSMGRINGGDSLDHAARAMLMALKAFRLAFKNEPGVEVRVVAYNENPQLSIIGNYMQVKDLSDAVLYKVIVKINEIQNTCRGGNCGVRMMTKAVQDVSADMQAHPDTTYVLLHIGDGDPGADIAAKIRAIYDDPTNAKIRFANLAAGRQAQDMYDKYQPHSYWAQELSELGMKWGEIVEATFKKSWRVSH